MAEDARGGPHKQATLVHINRERTSGRTTTIPPTPEADWQAGGIQPLAPARSPWGYVFGAALTVFWLGVVGAYLVLAVGLPGLKALPPLDAAAGVGAVFGPLAFLWLVIAYADRGATVRREAEALRRHLALLAYPAEAAEGRITTIAESLRAQTRELAQATRDAGSEAENLRLVLSRETAELNRLNLHINQETTRALESVAQEVQGLHGLMEKVSALAREMDQALERQHGALDHASSRAERQAERLTSVLGQQSADLEAAAKAVADQVAAVEAAAARHADLLAGSRDTTQAFTTAAEALTKAAESTAGEIAGRTEALRIEREQLSAQATALVEDLRLALHQISALGDEVARRGETFEDINRRLAETSHAAAQELDSASAAALGDFNAFRDSAGEALEGARAAAAAIRDAAAQGENVRRLLNTQARGLEQAIKALGEQVRSTGLSMDEQAQAVHQTSERAAERIRHLTELLSRNAVDITRTTARAVVEIETVSEGLKAGIGEVRDATSAVQEAAALVGRSVEAAFARVEQVRATMEEGRESIHGAADTFAAEGDRIAEAANATVEALARLGNDLREEADGVVAAAEGALGRTDALRERLGAVLSAFEAGVARGAGEVERAGERLRLAAEVFEATATHAGDAMGGRADDLEARLKAFDKAASEAQRRVEAVTAALDKHAGLLDASGKRGAEHARRAAAELAKQAETLVAVTKAAEQRARELETAREAVDVQRFLTDTSYVIERLQAAAVDITRLFTPSVEEDLWKRFYKGEQNVFLRHAAKTITRSQANTVKKLFAQNREFRTYAQRYMSEYEALLKAARANDRADVLTAVFTSSDMGRLYMVLARSTNRGGA